jgi:hypothetical protein
MEFCEATRVNYGGVPAGIEIGINQQLFLLQERRCVLSFY